MVFISAGRSSGLKSSGVAIQAVYQLAKLFGYTYLANKRLPLTHNPDVEEQAELYRFVGYHLDEKDISDPEFADCERIEVSLDEIVTATTSQIDDVRKLLDAKAQCAAGKRGILLLNWFAGTEARRHFNRLVEAARASTKANIDFDFRSKYQRAKELYYPEFLPRASDDRISVCIHVRRGDIAVVPVGDRFLVNWWEKGYAHRILTAAEYRAGFSSFPHIEIERFQAVRDRLVRLHGEERLAFRFFSDGYNSKYFEWVRDHLPTLGFADFDAFRRFLLEHQTKEFAPFARYAQHLGEGVEDTKRAIHAFVTSDVVVKGCGDFAGFFVEKCRTSPPKLFIDFRKDKTEAIARKLDEYDRQVRRGLLSFGSKIAAKLRRVLWRSAAPAQDSGR